ncbi:hypothetical protein BASA61_006937 [Batrachochytrium salamandrivorans]|nr:hypothetical protein BASA61_006937 [Batrachochytrium salamandrivorans]KAH9245800.1 hypothetical protein BASA81_016690 [Batrachochytrium salamandrivorans]
MHYLLFLSVAVRVEPFSSPRKSLMQSIKLRLYEANDDQITVVMARLDESSQTPLQLLSSSALATKRWQQSVGNKAWSSSRIHKAARQSSEKSHFLEHATG